METLAIIEMFFSILLLVFALRLWSNNNWHTRIAVGVFAIAASVPITSMLDGNVSMFEILIGALLCGLGFYQISIGLNMRKGPSLGDEGE